MLEILNPTLKNFAKKLLGETGYEFLKSLRNQFRQNQKFHTTSYSREFPKSFGFTESELLEFVLQVRVSDAPITEIQNYAREDFKRFAYTVELCKELKGKCLEIGSNPYFTTALLKKLTPLETVHTNYFHPSFGKESSQTVYIPKSIRSKELELETIPYFHFNCETESFPFPEKTFDVLLFCEVLEHMTNDPLKVLLEIKRILKPNGHLILTTPNVARLENVAKAIVGENIYDPYSGYGPYGRHNREYTRHEVFMLLNHLGFETEISFTSDVHENYFLKNQNLKKIIPLVKHRQNDLGQYLFFRAKNSGKAIQQKPSWLYRSYPENEIV